MTRFISRIIRDDTGAAAIEYGLIAALAPSFVIGVVQLASFRPSSAKPGR